MTRIETIKAKYDAGELSYEAALGRLEALGMWADDAAAYLAVPPQDRT